MSDDLTLKDKIIIGILLPAIIGVFIASVYLGFAVNGWWFLPAILIFVLGAS